MAKAEKKEPAKTGDMKKALAEGRFQDVTGIRYSPYKERQFTTPGDKRDNPPADPGAMRAGGGAAGTPLAAVDLTGDDTVVSRVGGINTPDATGSAATTVGDGDAST